MIEEEKNRLRDEEFEDWFNEQSMFIRVFTKFGIKVCLHNTLIPWSLKNLVSPNVQWWLVLMYLLLGWDLQ